MESLAALLQRKCGAEKSEQLKNLASRIMIVGAYDTTRDGLLVPIDGGKEWIDADSIDPPANPLRLIVIRQSDGESNDSPYQILERVIGNIRKAANGLCEPDWGGLLACAYVDKQYEMEWIASLPNTVSAQDTGIRKRAALIEEVVSFWSSVEKDLSGSDKNGLHEAAKHPKHGFWKVEPALIWARQRGRIDKQRAESYVKRNDESPLSPMLRQLLALK